jgi:hypothetical protein
MSGGCGCARHGFDEIDDRLPWGAAWRDLQCVPTRPSLALPKYVGFFEAFLKYEPAAATDMPAAAPSFLNAARLLPVPSSNGLL